MIVIDASALLEVLLRTSAAESVEERIFAPGTTLHAPHVIDVEIAQVLSRYAAAGELSAERGRAALEDLSDLRITRYPHIPFVRRVWELRDDLTAYDALYVALAEALEAPLLTADRRLAAAPGHDAEVLLVGSDSTKVYSSGP